MISFQSPFSSSSFSHLFKPHHETLDFFLERRILEFPVTGIPRNLPLRFSKLLKRNSVNMRDRSKNRKPLQRGRNLSIEAIQTVQSLKRAARIGDVCVDRVFESKVSRLLKLDLIAVLRELQRQNEPLLALKVFEDVRKEYWYKPQVFEDVRKEYWYKPQVLLYAEMIAVLGRNGMFEKVNLLFSYMKMEILESRTEEINAFLRILLEYGICGIALECYNLMEKVGCEPDKSTFRIMVNGLESKGELALSAAIRKDAEKYYGGSLDFFEEKEPESDSIYSWGQKTVNSTVWV